MAMGTKGRAGPFFSALLLLIATSISIGRIARADGKTSEGSVSLEGSTLRYEGLITDASNQRLRELYESSDPRPSVLRIRSFGGEINAGMDLGNFVFDRELVVEVFEYCFSSCANYVVTAARSLRLEPTAVLGWHGGATQKIDPQTVSVTVDGKELQGAERRAQLTRLALEKMMRSNIERETAFFERVGVDPRITVLGQTDFYRERYTEAQKYSGWYFSLEDLRRLGVRPVTVIGDGEWQPGELPGGYKVFRVPLEATPDRPSAAE